MEVILKEDVVKLGSRGDVVKVAEGYGRNFLLPRKLAIEASAGNKKVIEQMRAASVRRSAKENNGFLLSLIAMATKTRSNSLAARSITSRWPLVNGSKLPG